MPKLSRYPRGFLAVNEATDLGQSSVTQMDIAALPSDPEVEVLYDMFIKRQVDPSSWKFQREVIRVCAKLFGNFHRWLAIQAVYNDNVYNLNFEFLLDTVQFIRTGQRNMSVFTWNELLLEYPEPQFGVASVRRLEEFKISDPKEFENAIGRWCSQRGGFEDMLCAAHVLYGVSKKPMGAPKLKF